MDNTNDQEEVIVGDLEDNNEEVTEETEEKAQKATKPKRTPQEEYEYFKGRTERLAKKLGIKDEKVEPMKSTQSDKPSDLDYGHKAFLKSYGIAGSDELALVRQFQDRGFALDSIVEDDVFTSKLNSLREARESANAIPKTKGRSAQASVTDIDLAYAEFQEKGVWPSDFETAKKLKDKIVAMEKGSASIYASK